MDNIGGNYWKPTAVKGNITDKLHEDYLLEIRYEIWENAYLLISSTRIIYWDKQISRIKSQHLIYKEN